MDNPDPTHFRHLYKHASLTNLLAAPTTASCEADEDGLLAVLRQVAAGTSEQPEPAPPLPVTSMEPHHLEIPMTTHNVLSYVGGIWYVRLKSTVMSAGALSSRTQRCRWPTQRPSQR